MIATRPVIPGFHPDPSICRVGSAYYLVTSSFEYSPGVPIFRSTDLVEWSQIGNVLDRPEQLEGVGIRASGGIYAPTLRHHDDRFWMITTNVTHGPGQLLVTAEDPAGPWSAPLRIPEALGIDPDLTWGDDGRCWLSWSGADEDARHGILQAQLDTTTGALVSETSVIWRGTGGQYPEGPHLYARDGSWYLVIAEGGTERGHAVTVARSDSPNGPFLPSPTNPFLTARSTDWPTQNTGHADFVENEDGSWAVVFLGARPRGATPGWHVLGRETFAARLVWDGGWPVLGDPIEPSEDAVAVEALPSGAVPSSWVSPSGLPGRFLRPGVLGWELSGGPDVFVGRRQEHRFTSTVAEVGAGSALELRIDGRDSVRLEVAADAVRAIATIGGIRILLGESHTSVDPTIELRTEPSSGPIGTPEEGPDEIVARVRQGEGWIELGRLDGRYVSTETAGGYTGRMIGLSAGVDTTAVRRFVYRGSDSFDLLTAALTDGVEPRRIT
jgi:xylan 1,4-beta-xylosidase